MSMKLFRLIIAARIDKVLSVTSAIEKFVTLFRKKKKRKKNRTGRILDFYSNSLNMLEQRSIR